MAADLGSSSSPSHRPARPLTPPTVPKQPSVHPDGAFCHHDLLDVLALRLALLLDLLGKSAALSRCYAFAVVLSLGFFRLFLAALLPRIDR